MNREEYINTLFKLSTEALRAMVENIRAEASSGIISNKEAHDRINCISAVLMTKEMEKAANER